MLVCIDGPRTQTSVSPPSNTNPPPTLHTCPNTHSSQLNDPVSDHAPTVYPFCPPEHFSKHLPAVREAMKMVQPFDVSCSDLGLFRRKTSSTLYIYPGKSPLFATTLFPSRGWRVRTAVADFCTVPCAAESGGRIESLYSTLEAAIPAFDDQRTRHNNEFTPHSESPNPHHSPQIPKPRAPSPNRNRTQRCRRRHI